LVYFAGVVLWILKSIKKLITFHFQMNLSLVVLPDNTNAYQW
jgi:hypothetical protein